MRVFTTLLLASTAVFCAALIEPTPAKANDPITFDISNDFSPSKVKDSCEGGQYFPPSSIGEYGCVNDNGSGIVCGGVGKDATTCTVFFKPPKPTRLRSQVELRATAQGAKQTGK
jgi:hypothetical protein